MLELKPLLAISSGILAFISFIPYFVTMFQGTTKPNRVTWCIWTIQGWMLTATYYYAGGIENIWLPLADTILVSIIAFLSLWFGIKTWTKLDVVSLIGAVISIGVWIVSGSAISALYFGILVSLIGALPTLQKTYRYPETEHALSWGIFSCAAILNILTLPTLFSYENVYPFYLLIINGSIFLLAIRPQKS